MSELVDAHPSAANFYLWHLGLPLALALFIFIGFDLTSLDLAISDALYDPGGGHFILQQSALFTEITFRWTRQLPDLVEKLALIGALLGWFCSLVVRFNGAPTRRATAPALMWLAAHQRDCLYVVVAFASSTWLIQFMKLHTGVDCPVDLARYGGDAPLLHWFQTVTVWHAQPHGRCWPSGHAATGFNLMSLYFVMRHNRWRHAKALLTSLLVPGMATGAIRTLQGWHFLSHTLWSAVLVWSCLLLVAWLFYGTTALTHGVVSTEPLPGVVQPGHSQS